MSKHFVVIKSLSASILVISENAKDIKRLKSSSFLKRYIPSYSLDNSDKKSDCVLYLKKGSSKIKINYPTAYYYNNKYDEKDIVSLAEYLLERARQERGLYCLHGSACALGARTVIFWGGASGMGKTSLCHKLENNFGANFIADEKIIMNLKKLTMVGGVNVAYKKNNQFINLNIKPIQSITVHFFVYPFLSPENENKLEFIPWNNKKFEWHLYEELNRKIRGTSRTFFNGTEPVLSLDTINLAKKRIKAINWFVSRIKNYQIRGSSDKICNKVVKLIKPVS